MPRRLPSPAAPGGLARAQVLTQDGQLVVSVVQEGLVGVADA